MLGTVEASCIVHKKTYRICYDIDKKALNKLFHFGAEEFFLSSVIVGSEIDETCDTALMQVPYVDGTGVFEANNL